MNNQSFCERRHQTLKLAQELLDKRDKVWALHGHLIKLKPDSEEQALEPLVRQFCQELIDYISLEHFGIFHHLLGGNEQRRSILVLADEIFPQMVETTDIALDFNDKCEALSPAFLQFELPGELVILRDALARRVELEDVLIEAMTS